MLTAVISGTPLDPTHFPVEDEALNEGLLGELNELSPVEVVQRLESDSEKMLELLAKLTDEHENRRQRDFPMSLGEALSQMPQHERGHMEQLRTALTEGR